MHARTTHQRHHKYRVLRLAASIPLTAAASWIGYSTLFLAHNLPLPPALSGEQRELNGRTGRLSYYVAGTGAPMLLIHSINAAGSSYEVRPLFEHYRQSRRVYALDLPGFGFSDRSPRNYTPRLYADAIMDMVTAIELDTGTTSVDALALSLSAEFLARAASEHPDRFRTLAFITPTGFGKGIPHYAAPDSTPGNPVLRSVFDFPLWNRPFFDLLTSKPSIRFFLAQTFGSYAAIDTGLYEYCYLTTHQPGAQHAPYAFVSGLLFSTDIGRVYDALTQPVWLAYGTRGAFSDVRDLQRVQSQPNWTIQSFETGALPFFEQPAAFIAAYDQFLINGTGTGQNPLA